MRFIVAIFFILSGFSTTFAQKEQPIIFNENLPYSFPKVFKTIKTTLQDKGCSLERDKYSEGDNGLFKGNIKSEFCVFVEGEDSTYTFLQRYSQRVPTIRGGIWLAGRVQYIIILREKDDQTVDMELKAEISGFEQYVTNQMQFFPANGVLEKEFIALLKENLARSKSE